MTYRTDFAIKLIGSLVFGLIAPLISILIYSVSQGIAGWTLYQLLILQGTMTFVIGTEGLLFGMLSWDTMESVREGRYDLELIRPIKPMTLATAKGPNLDLLSGQILGATIIIISAIKSNTHFSLQSTLLYLMLIVLGIIFLFALRACVGAFSFWFVRTWSLVHLMDTIKDIGRNPISIFGPGGLILFSFFIPIGVASFYPAQALFGRINILLLIPVAISVFAFLGLSILIWRLAIKKYSSAGG